MSNFQNLLTIKDRSLLQIALLEYYRSIRQRYVSLYLAAPACSDFWTALVLCVFCICVSFPSYELFLEPNEIVLTNWSALQEQADAPLTPHLHPAEEHHGQLAFRLLLPGLAHLLHLPMMVFFVLLPVAGWGFFRILLALGRRGGLGVWGSLLLTLGMAATYVGKAFFVDVIGYFDAYCYILLLVSIYAKPRWAALLAYLASLFIDERAYLAVPLAAVARFWMQAEQPDLGRLVKETAPALGILVVGLVIRYTLHEQFGLVSGAQSGNLGLATLRDNFQISSIGLLTGLEFYTYAAFLPGMYFFLNGQRLLGMGYIAYLGACLLSMLLVLDLTRCTAYLFPAVLAGIFALARFEKPSFTERTLVALTLSALLFPPLFVVGDYILWMGPIVPKIIRIVARLGFGTDI